MARRLGRVGHGRVYDPAFKTPSTIWAHPCGRSRPYAVAPPVERRGKATPASFFLLPSRSGEAVFRQSGQKSFGPMEKKARGRSSHLRQRNGSTTSRTVTTGTPAAMAHMSCAFEQTGGSHGERGGGCCCGPLIGNRDSAFRSDAFGNGTGRPLPPSKRQGQQTMTGPKSRSDGAGTASGGPQTVSEVPSRPLFYHSLEI